MAYAFNHRAKNSPSIGELLSAAFPHFEALIVPFEAGQEVVGEGDPTENFFLVMRGLFRAVKFTRDGRRQVFAFYMPGDLCGLEPDGTHKLTIEAVDCAAMAVLPRHACRLRMNDDPRLNAALFDGATRALTLTVDHMMMVGRSSAEERLAWFLTMLSGRSACPSAHVLRSGDAAPGYCRLSRTDDRNGEPHVHALQGSRPYQPAAQAPGPDPACAMCSHGSPPRTVTRRRSSSRVVGPRIWRPWSPDVTGDGCANGMSPPSVRVQPYLQVLTAGACERCGRMQESATDGHAVRTYDGAKRPLSAILDFPGGPRARRTQPRLTFDVWTSWTARGSRHALEVFNDAIQPGRSISVGAETDSRRSRSRSVTR